MRLISQDGTIDVPYEQASIETRTATNQCEIWCRYSSIPERNCVAKRFATYSTPEKAQKAMRMLHEHFEESERFKSLGYKAIENLLLNYGKETTGKLLEKDIFNFQFPKEDEV